MHKMFGDTIVMCIKSGESDCCTFDECPLLKQCFPDAYESWQKQISKDKEGGDASK